MQGIELTEYTIWYALAIVVAAILLDAVLGVLKSFKADTEPFDIRKLPQFVATNILPYVGGLAIFALVANIIGNPFDQSFYVVAAAVLVKYLVEIKDKLSTLFNINLEK